MFFIRNFIAVESGLYLNNILFAKLFTFIGHDILVNF
jgi:hypothetical protein